MAETVVCSSCHGPAQSHLVNLDGQPVAVVQCLECDCIRCSKCGVLVTSRHALKCAHGHIL